MLAARRATAWRSSSGRTPGPPAGFRRGLLGLVSSPFNPDNTDSPAATVAVEFDAFRNEWDPKNTTSHVGVDVNNISSVAYAALPDGCFNGTMSAWVRYDANASTLSVTLRFDDRPGLGVYNVSARVDLRAEELPQQAGVGFSATTGDRAESHQILSWSFKSTLTNVAVINKTGKWIPFRYLYFFLFPTCCFTTHFFFESRIYPISIIQTEIPAV